MVNNNSGRIISSGKSYCHKLEIFRQATDIWHFYLEGREMETNVKLIDNNFY